MRWRTYTPDGRTLDVEQREDGLWVAECESGTATGSTPWEAIAACLGSERTIGATPGALAAWIAERAEQYEREAGGLED